MRFDEKSDEFDAYLSLLLDGPYGDKVVLVGHALFRRGSARKRGSRLYFTEMNSLPEVRMSRCSLSLDTAGNVSSLLMRFSPKNSFNGLTLHSSTRDEFASRMSLRQCLIKINESLPRTKDVESLRVRVRVRVLVDERVDALCARRR